VRVDHVLDLNWLPSEVAGLYCADNGRPGIDPEVAVRLILAGFLLGIVQDRRLMREAQVNFAIRWFIGYALHEALPDHSSLTRIRQRWGEDVFRRVFTRVVRQCQLAGLVSAETVHIDASLIRANVSMDVLILRHLDAVEEANDAARDERASGMFKKLCRTDPDATMATSSKAPLRPAYKQHTAVDDLAGVVVDIDIVTGEEHDTGRFEARLDAIEDTLGVAPGRITADTIYGVGRVYAALEDRQIEAVIPPLRPPPPSGRARLSNRAVQVRSPSRRGPVSGKEAADRQKQHEIGSMVPCRSSRLRALSPQGTVFAPGHPIPLGAHRDKPRSHPARSLNVNGPGSFRPARVG
jgi:transposase